ncbi:inhibitor of apoptosis-promoting Bax1-domain-containing protein [Daedaleopsis nitida]|nr:inhibitor of apoptosis-promoting Bax1-domain-containing protein [Daedaleopsis nitida]
MESRSATTAPSFPSYSPTTTSIIMAHYDNPPPPYPGPAGKTVPPGYDEASQPLLGSSAAGRSAIYYQPAAGEIPDDFLYGATVAECALQIRNEFVRKVYTILFCQIVATTIVAGFIRSSPNTVLWVLTHSWSFYVPLFGTLVNLGLLYWKRHNVPLNYILLSTFTLLEAFTLGIMTAFFDNEIVLQALLITIGVFLGLTLFTLQSKYDFSGMGSWLFAGLFALLTTGLVGMLFPFSRTMDLVFAFGGCLLFSGYVIYDTYMITKRLSHDEYISAAISLYLE